MIVYWVMVRAHTYTHAHARPYAGHGLHLISWLEKDAYGMSEAEMQQLVLEITQRAPQPSTATGQEEGGARQAPHPATPQPPSSDPPAAQCSDRELELQLQSLEHSAAQGPAEAVCESDAADETAGQEIPADAVMAQQSDGGIAQQKPEKFGDAAQEGKEASQQRPRGSGKQRRPDGTAKERRRVPAQGSVRPSDDGSRRSLTRQRVTENGGMRATADVRKLRLPVRESAKTTAELQAAGEEDQPKQLVSDKAAPAKESSTKKVVPAVYSSPRTGLDGPPSRSTQSLGGGMIELETAGAGNDSTSVDIEDMAVEVYRNHAVH